eukprot:4077239-Pyramimonas_sp.AAC.1
MGAPLSAAIAPPPGLQHLGGHHMGAVPCQPLEHGGLRAVHAGDLHAAVGAAKVVEGGPLGTSARTLCLVDLLRFSAGAGAGVQGVRDGREHRPEWQVGALPVVGGGGAPGWGPEVQGLQLHVQQLHAPVKTRLQEAPADGRALLGKALRRLHRRRHEVPHESRDPKQGKMESGQ